MKNEKYSVLRRVEIVKLIRVSVNEGDGTAEDPIVRVENYFDLDGNLLWHTDKVERFFRGGKE